MPLRGVRELGGGWYSPNAMKTERQMVASRQNGQKSKGPITAMEKDRIRLNALKQGLTARLTLWRNENPEQSQNLFAALWDQFAPANDVEFLGAEEMTMAKWRMRRVVSLETASGNYHLMAEPEKESKGGPTKEADKPDAPRAGGERSIEAFLSAQDDGQLLPQCRQHEASYARAYQQAYRHLCELRENSATSPVLVVSGVSAFSGRRA